MKDDGTRWRFDPKFKPLMTGPRNGPHKEEWEGKRTDLPFNVEDELRTMAGYKEGCITAGREFAVIAKALLWIALLVSRKDINRF